MGILKNMFLRLPLDSHMTEKTSALFVICHNYNIISSLHIHYITYIHNIVTQCVKQNIPNYDADYSMTIMHLYTTIQPQV